MLLCGLHQHQFPSNWEDRLARLRIPIIALLTMDAGYWIPKLYRPGQVVILRKYDSDAMGHNPAVWADSVDQEVRDIAARYGIPLKDIIAQGYNELELDVEHNNSGYAGQPWDSDAAWPVRRDWIMAFHRRMNDRNPEYRVGVLWSSPGHQDVDGRQEIQQFIDAGLFDLKNIEFGGHYYARGLTEAGNPSGDGGYDAPDREWYSDRCLKVRDILDANDLHHIRIWIGETNRKDIGQGDILGELDRWSGRIARAVAGWTFFIWDSPDPSFATFRLGSVLTSDPQLNRFQALIDRYATATPPPEPEPEPPPTPSEDAEIARIEAKFNMAHHDGQRAHLLRLIERTDPNNITALGPPGLRLRVKTKDNAHVAEGEGRVDMEFGHPAAYSPTEGEIGFYRSETEDAWVDGQGWPLIPGDTASHRNVVAEFAAGPRIPPVPEPEPEPEPTPPPGVTMTPGIDVAVYQGVIDWPTVAASGVQFAVIKSTEGVGYRDPTFSANWYGAKAAGLVVGSYHFMRADLGNNPKDEADWFLSVVGPVLGEGDFLCLDVEDFPNRPQPADLRGWVLTWLDYVFARVGFRPLIYSTTGYLASHNLTGGPELAQFGIWIADWRPPTTGFPAPPPDWPVVALWQHSGSGSTPGIVGQVDQDLFNGPVDRLKLYGKPTPPPPPDRAALDALWVQKDVCRATYLDPVSQAALTEIERQVDVIKGATGIYP